MRRVRFSVLFLVAACAALFSPLIVHAARWQGTVESSNCYATLASFAFAEQSLSTFPNLYYSVTFPREYEDSIWLSVFYDDFSSVTDFTEASNDNQVTCQERLTFARQQGYVTLLDGAINFEKNYTTNVRGEDVVQIVASTNIVQSVERFWTMALINTARDTRSFDENEAYVDGPLAQIEYDVTFGNIGRTLEFASTHEERALFGSIATAVVQFVALTMTVWILMQLVVARNVHHIFTVFFVGVVVEFISAAFFIATNSFNAAESHNRVGSSVQPNLGFIAMLLHRIATGIFLLAACFLAKGWNIVRYKITADGRVKLVVFFTFYVVFSVLAVAYDTYSAEAVAARSLLFSPFISAMVAIQVAIDCAALVWISRIAFLTINTFQRKKGLLTKMAVFNGIWLLLQVACPFVAAGLNHYWRAMFLSIGMLAPNILLEFVYIAMFFPGGEIRKTFSFKDKGAKKSSFDVNPKHVNDEVDADDMRPVEQVYAHWLRKHASANHTPFQLLMGKISHVVLRVKHKRTALERRLRLFYQLLESYIPELKEVAVTPSADGVGGDGFETTHMLQIRGQNIGGVGRNDGVDDDSNDPNKRPVKQTAGTATITRKEQHASTTANALEKEADDPELEAAAARRREKKAKKKKKKKQNKDKEEAALEEESDAAAASGTQPDSLKKQSVAPVEPAASPKRTGSDDEDDEIRRGAPEGEEDALSRRRARSRSKSRSKNNRKNRSRSRSRSMVDDDVLATDSNADADTPHADSAAKAMAILSKAKAAKKEAKETDNEQDAESKDTGGNNDTPSETRKSRSRSRSRGAKKSKKSSRKGNRRKLADDDE